MDPQGRVLLEQTGLVLADAGARLGQPVDAKTGVYVGVMHMEYIQLLTGAALHGGSPFACRNPCAVRSNALQQLIAAHPLRVPIQPGM